MSAFDWLRINNKSNFRLTNRFAQREFLKFFIRRTKYLGRPWGSFLTTVMATENEICGRETSEIVAETFFSLKSKSWKIFLQR